MYCSYHSSTVARVQCASCSRSLCPACDHRIKGYAYCQDCIVRGVEGLSAYRYHGTRTRSRALKAAILALVPGMGAAYNRQNVKAVVHFFTIAGLFQLTKVHLVPGLFALAGFVCYVYSIIDAHRTAQSIARGESPAEDEERFKRALVRRAPALGVFLIVAGILFVVNILRPVALLALAKLFPVLLILLGGYLLTKYFKRRRDEVSPEYSPKTPYSLVPGSFGARASEQVRRLSRPGQR
jgi:Ca2+/Na+ antiporter